MASGRLREIRRREIFHFGAAFQSGPRHATAPRRRPLIPTAAGRKSAAAPPPGNAMHNGMRSRQFRHCTRDRQFVFGCRPFRFFVIVEPRITLITLGVSDLPRAVRFYRDGLGWPTTYQEGGPIAFFSTTGTRFSLYPLEHLAADISPDLPPMRSGFGGITLAHNVRTKAEVAEVLAHAERAGARIMKPAQDVFWGGHSGYFCDPDGYYWEVAWNPSNPLDAEGFMDVSS